MKKTIEKVDLTRKTYSVKNYKEFFKFSKNVFLGEKQVEKMLGYKKTGLKITQTPDKIFVIDDKIYLARGGNLYLKTSTIEKSLCSTGSVINGVTEVISGGKRLPLLIAENGLYLISESSATKNDWVSAKVAIEHCGRLFSASGRIITFSKRFNFETQTIPLTISGSLRVDKSAGNILGFLSNNEKLFVFCQRAIYTIKSGEESLDFEFRKIRFLQFEIDKNTFVTANGKAFFISDKKVYSFDGERFKVYGEYLRALESFEIADASFSKNNYSLCLKNQAENYLYVCDTVNDLEGVIPIQYGVTSNGYGVIDDELFMIDETEENLSACLLESKKLPLSIKGQFTLCEISVNFGGQGKLVALSNCGKKAFTLKDGVNRFKFMLCADWVKLEFVAEKSCSISNLLLKYVEKGD